MSLFFSYLLKFLDLIALFIILVLILCLVTQMCLLRYTRSQKGYKCFSPSLNHYFISADVTFIEYSFYFKSLSSPPVSPSPIAFDTSVVYSVPKDSSNPPPLQVYSPSDDSLLVLALPPLWL